MLTALRLSDGLCDTFNYNLLHKIKMTDEWKTQTCLHCNCLKKNKSCGNPEHHKLPVGEQLITFPCSLGAGFRESESGGIELVYMANAELSRAVQAPNKTADGDASA